MQVNISGHQLEVTPALREFTNEKLSRLSRHNHLIQDIHVILSVDKLDQIAEATVHVTGTAIHASSKSENLYTAVDLLIDKLDSQLVRHKEKMISHRDHRDHHGRSNHSDQADNQDE